MGPGTEQPNTGTGVQLDTELSYRPGTEQPDTGKGVQLDTELSYGARYRAA